MYIIIRYCWQSLVNITEVDKEFSRLVSCQKVRDSAGLPSKESTAVR